MPTRPTATHHMPDSVAVAKRARRPESKPRDADEADERERQIGQHVGRVRNAEPRALVGEAVVALVLRDDGKQRAGGNDQRNRRRIQMASVGEPVPARCWLPRELGFHAPGSRRKRGDAHSCASQVPRLRPRERLDAVRRQRQSDSRVTDARPRQPRAHAIAAVPVDAAGMELRQDPARALRVVACRRRPSARTRYRS